MTGLSRTPPKGGKRTSEVGRRERLAGALRDNLARRKAQGRSRAEAEEASSTSGDDKPAPSPDGPADPQS